MIDFSIAPESSAALDAALQAEKAAILTAVRAGMLKAMQDLAEAAAAEAPRRTGALQAALIDSPKVKDNSREIVGTVKGDMSGFGKRPASTCPPRWRAAPW